MFRKKSWVAMGYGLLAIFSIVLVMSLVLSLLLKFTDLQESALNWVIIGSAFIALFIGGLIAGGKGEEKGLIIGAGTGILFSLLILLIQFLGFELSFSLSQTLYHVGYILCAIFGGIIGVNLTGKQTTHR